jgi:hypothetical protein
MEVNQENFHKQLLPILSHLANAAFVAFDLEMSGISAKPKYSTGERTNDVGKPNLQQQYSEMKDAAEKFQILQLGITIVEEDQEKGESIFSFIILSQLTAFNRVLSCPPIQLQLEPFVCSRS